MRHVLVAMLVSSLAASPSLAQNTPPNISGIWSFTAVRFTGTIRITQTATTLAGDLLSNGAFVSAFRGSVLTESTRKEDVIIYWNSDFRNIPGVAIGAIYWGDIGGDGKSMGGQYGLGRGTILGTWRATRLAGLGPAIAKVTNAANGMSGAIAPGEIVSIYADPITNPIGPAKGSPFQLDQNGMVPKTIAGVEVYFQPGNAFAPLTWVSSGQINAVVPYELAGWARVWMQIRYIGQVSEAVELQVVATHPGIFTMTGTGVGQAAALNGNGSLNGPNNPEPRGGVAVLFLTGAGQTAPPGVSGRITTVSPTPPLTPLPVAPVSVRIGGQPAAILYCGEAPGLVSGVLQLNVGIPTTISPGNVPVHVLMGGGSAQDGVTVSVQ